MWLLYVWVSVLTLLVALQSWVLFRHRRYFLGFDERSERLKRQMDVLSSQLPSLMKDGVRRRVDELRKKWAASDPPNAADVREACNDFLLSLEKEMARPSERRE
ncbi:MAG: hypothetical protein ABSA67_02325 [Candidatus Brocadiia bacterium]